MKQRGVAVSARSYAEIERLAARSRRVLAPRKELHEPLNGESLFERLDDFNVSGVQLDYGVCGSDAIGGAEALTYFDPHKGAVYIMLSEVAHGQLSDGYARPLFTVSHEIGHAVMHMRILKEAHILRHGLARGGEHKRYRDSEWQADAFAAALIAPAAGIARLGLTTADEIGRAFGMSDEASRIRLQIFNQHRSDLLGGAQ